MHAPRSSGWENRLADYLRDARARPFAWGEHDCCLHMSAAIRVQCGDHVDHAADVRGSYKAAAGARAMLRKNYRGDVWHVPATLGLEPVDVMRAQRGYIVGAIVGRRKAIGVCGGAKSFFVGKNGFVTIPTLDCERAWRVG